MTAEPLPATPATPGRRPESLTPDPPSGSTRDRVARRIEAFPVAGQLARFAAIGVVSTLVYVALYALLRLATTAAAANALALVVTAIGNTAANRRLTFGVTGGERMLRHQVAGLVAFAIALGITTASIGLLHAVSAQPSRAAEIMVLVLANVVATALRFLVLRRVIDRPGRAAPLTAATRA